MKHRYQLIEDDDPYGPGADLLISLFAMAVLMIGLIGAGGALHNVADAEAARRVAQLETDLANARTLVRSLDDALRKPPKPESAPPPSVAAARIAQLEAQLKIAKDALAKATAPAAPPPTPPAVQARIAELEAELSAATRLLEEARANSAASPKSTPDQPPKRAAELEKDLQAAIAAQQNTQKKLDDATRDVADLRALVARYKAALQQKNDARIDVADLSGDTGPLFQSCDGATMEQYACSLKPSARLIEAIVAGLRQRAADLEAIQANQLVVEVQGLTLAYESPVTRQAEGQLDLSADRAVATVHELAARGLPYMCMVPIGLGRSRSAALRGQIERGQEALKSWDALMQNPENAKALSQPGDLRVTVYVRNDDIDNACPPASFSHALAGLRG